MDMIMVYLMVSGLESISFDQLFTYCDLSTRSNGYKLYKNYCHLKSKLDVYWQDLRVKFLE